MNTNEIEAAVGEVLDSTPFIDIHTHLFAPAFGRLALWGIDDLLTYHYLEAELFRFTAIRPAQYWNLTKTQRAELVWKTLFVENTPVSEATRGVVAVLRAFRLPDNRFLVTVLSRENQHELCVYARKFSNILPFGCWWFLNNPSIVEEITRERLEMLGTSFIPQHSDARVLEQLIYKWRNTRRTLAPILANSYKLLAEDGRPVTPQDIRRDIRRLFRDNFEQWTQKRAN